MASQFVDMRLSSIFLTLLCVSLVKFRYKSIIHVISLLVFKLWEFLFLKDWPELTELSLLVLQNYRITAFEAPKNGKTVTTE